MKQQDLIDVFRDADKIQKAANVDAVLAILTTCLEAFGYRACLITNLPAPHIEHWDDHILANRWPDEWFRHYNALGHYRHDPCVARCRYTAEPFLWTDVDNGDLDASGKLVMGEAAEFGLRQGICVPLHVPLALSCVVTVSGDAVDLSPVTQQTVHVLARSALSAVARFAGGKTSVPGPILSQREAEILQWAAVGKTAWETSRILAVSEHTILTHLRNAKQKLETVNIVQAAVEGLRRREIQF